MKKRKFKNELKNNLKLDGVIYNLTLTYFSKNKKRENISHCFPCLL